MAQTHLLVTVFRLSRYRKMVSALPLCITALTMILTGDGVRATVIMLLQFVTVFSVIDPPSNPSLALRFHHPSHLLSLVCWPKWWGFMPGTVAKATHERKQACFPKKE